MGVVYLRALELDDLQRTHKWHNDPQLYSIMGGTLHHVSLEAEEKWLRGKMGFSQNEINLAICLTENSQHIGNIYLRNIDWVNRNAEMQIWIGEKDRRSQGYGYEAHKMLQEYAFKTLGLMRLYLFIQAGNSSIKLAEKFGFVVEGKLRQHAYIDGEFKDFILMGLFNGEDDIDKLAGEKGT